MSKKLLYPLTGLNAMTLRRCAREEASPVALCAADELIALDRDAAVERMARATYGPKAWDALDPSDPMEVVQRSAHKAQMRTAFNALLEVDA